MMHRCDLWHIEAHAQCVRTTDHIYFILSELSHETTSLFNALLRVISSALHSLALQDLCNLLAVCDVHTEHNLFAARC